MVVVAWGVIKLAFPSQLNTIAWVKKSPDDYCRIYLYLLAQEKAVRRSPAFPLLDLPEERLIDQLAASWSAGKKITVLKAMEMSADASSTTVHRRLKTLRQKRMLVLQLDEDDNRVKYILPTELALAYLAELGRSVERACTQGSVELSGSPLASTLVPRARDEAAELEPGVPWFAARG